MEEVMSVHSIVAPRATALTIWAGGALHKGTLLRRFLGSEMQGQGAAYLFDYIRHNSGWQWL